MIAEGNKAPDAIARRTPIVELPLTADQEEGKRRGLLEPNLRVFDMAECHVLVGRGPHGWHLSISHPARLPTWEELSEARYRLIPDSAIMAMVLPSREHYVNINPNVLQLVEVPELEGRIREL